MHRFAKLSERFRISFSLIVLRRAENGNPERNMMFER